MQTEVSIRAKRTLSDVLYSYGYIVNHEREGVLIVTLKEYETPLIIVEEEDQLYFQLDIIGVDVLVEDTGLYKVLLKLNADLTPLSLAIDDSREEGEVLILTEALARENIDENELESVMEAFETSIIDIAVVVKDYLKNQSYITEFEEKEG